VNLVRARTPVLLVIDVSIAKRSIVSFVRVPEETIEGDIVGTLFHAARRMPKVGGDHGVVVVVVVVAGSAIGIGGAQHGVLHIAIEIPTGDSSQALLVRRVKSCVGIVLLLFENDIQGPGVSAGSAVFLLYQSALRGTRPAADHHRRSEVRGPSMGGCLALVLVGMLARGRRSRYRCRLVVGVATE